MFFKPSNPQPIGLVEYCLQSDKIHLLYKFLAQQKSCRHKILLPLVLIKKILNYSVAEIRVDR